MPDHSIRLTWPTAIVLRGIDRGLRYGFELIEASGLRAGTVYPILRRLEEAGLLVGSWEPVSQSRAEGRPPRRYYRLTAAGEAKLAEAMARYPGVARTFDVSRAAARRAGA
jgi:DNA-binding PadR family transcriptional regulator